MCKIDQYINSSEPSTNIIEYSKNMIEKLLYIPKYDCKIINTVEK